MIIKKDRTAVEKREFMFVNFFRVLLILAIVGTIFTANWLNLMITIFTLALTYLPSKIAERSHIYLIPEFHLIILIFVFAAMYLGEYHNYYLKYWWWDILLHTFSGVILGFVGFIFIFMFNKEQKINVLLSPTFIAIFSFTFAVTIGALWEIFEFSMDEIFGMNMQKSGLVDTMWDLIVDSLGALFASITGYLYTKNGRETYITKLINKFLKKNLEEDDNNKVEIQ